MNALKRDGGSAEINDMEGIAAIEHRVQELQTSPPRPAGFGDALASVTLGQMLDLAPTAAGAVAAPVAPTVSVAGAGELLSPVEGRLTSGFGPRIHPISGGRKQHDGIDLAAPTGTPIRAAAAGTVTFAGARGGYGNLVIVDHDGGMETRYAHADRLDVRVGDAVAAGAQVATVGSTGHSTGPHLHFEVRRDGRAVDPQPLLPS